MRIAATLLLLMAISGVVLSLGAYTMLGSFLGDLSPRQYDQVVSGELHAILFSDLFWTCCLQPDLPRPSWFWDWMAAVLVFPLIVVVWLGMRRRMKYPCVAMGGVCLFLGVVPYAVGAVMARGSWGPSEVGSWLVVMLVGLLYSCLASAAFSASALFASIWPEAAEAIKRKVTRRRPAMHLTIGRN